MTISTINKSIFSPGVLDGRKNDIVSHTEQTSLYVRASTPVEAPGAAMALKPARIRTDRTNCTESYGRKVVRGYVSLFSPLLSYVPLFSLTMCSAMMKSLQRKSHHTALLMLILHSPFSTRPRMSAFNDPRDHKLTPEEIQEEEEYKARLAAVRVTSSHHNPTFYPASFIARFTVGSYSGSQATIETTA